jgi:hypothetical protein
VSAGRLFSDPHDVAWWLVELRPPRGCVQAVPDPADPLAVAAYAEALRQLYAEARAEAGAEPEPAP